MKQIYCLKCKKETETTDMTESKTKNKRNVMKGVCSTCGKNKSVFVRIVGPLDITTRTVSKLPNIASGATGKVTKLPGIVSVSDATEKASKLSGIVSATVSGKGFSLNNLINNLPIEIHQFAETGENIPGGSFNDQQKYSYCGPGTRYEQRIREGYKGINELDSMCKLHDQFYNENKDTQIRNLSDNALGIKADQIAANQNLDSAQRKDAKFLSGVMKTKARLGLGLGAPTCPSKKTKNYKRRPGMKH